ncbi:hypothetical protein CEXT_233641 [Caerostris extrusa]|uniref:Uncharacterized protein n=1 Tax=Caerostris extrusa TaxID=172846 RepID=A0AAV4XVS5_CAEEX|nr:hypothetical protein CEXT_233641 [Caerostris extrusa]
MSSNKEMNKLILIYPHPTITRPCFEITKIIFTERFGLHYTPNDADVTTRKMTSEEAILSWYSHIHPSAKGTARYNNISQEEITKNLTAKGHSCDAF